CYIYFAKLLRELAFHYLPLTSFYFSNLQVFAATYFQLILVPFLSETLKISKRTIYLWGTDIELPKMPLYHQHTLAYALAAYRKKQQQKIAA
ncbi:MAG: hypothetical protein HC836_46495, partial [Richelia sp. RM2_1_2]|nr:hypothetical protein [Richelia sp. RM2_1_2]